MADDREWLILIQDQPDKFEARRDTLPRHIEYYKPIRAANQLIFAGPMLQNHTLTNNALPMNGSVLVLRLAEEEDVWGKLRADPFCKEGIWDMDKITITPFKSTVRTPF